MNSLPKIIGFVGPKQVGKDTALNVLRDMYHHQQFLRVCFADKTKEEVAKACGVSLAFIEANKALFRPVLQWWGTDFKRKLYGDDHWIKAWEKKVNYIQSMHPDVIIVATDVRFLNEAVCINNCRGMLIRIQSVNKDFEEDLHQSETEQARITCDKIASNDFTGGLSVLRGELAKALL